MKKSFLILALFGLFFGARMQAQGTDPCEPTCAGIYFPYLANTCYICITNTCVTPNTFCQYYATPTTTGEWICLDGTTNMSYGSGCTPTTDAEGDSWNSGDDAPCLQVVVKNYNSTIIDTYSAYYDGTQWVLKWTGGALDHLFLSLGFQVPDIELYYGSGVNGWVIQLQPGGSDIG